MRKPSVRVHLFANVALSVGLAATLSLAAPAAEPVNPEPPADSPTTSPSDIVISAMKKELDRSFSKLKNAAAAPLYFMSYSLYDIERISYRATYGAINGDDNSHYRVLNVDLRVGDRHLDNSHQLRAGTFYSPPLALGMGHYRGGSFPLQDDADAIRNRLWMATDSAFKSAQQSYMRVKSNRDTRVVEEDDSDDFSEAKPVTYFEKPVPLKVDGPVWKDRLRKASAIYKEFPELSESTVVLNVDQMRRYLVNTEGTRIEDTCRSFRVAAEASAVAKDGMVVRLYDAVEVPKMEELPSQEELERMVRKLARAVVVLKDAPRAQPYVGPAILNSKATGVFFHEVLGHRVEGHRQKDETEGRTFTQKVGEQIMPPFMSVEDDPTRSTFGKTPLVGNYKYDDEGVPAERVSLVEKGVLKGFLMGRSPIRNFKVSNGHGRSSAGSDPVARQGNLIVDSSKRVPYPKLRAMLIQEAKAQHKPYGLIIDEIAGGFTITHSFMPQSYVLLPLRVTRVYVDGRPDELTRGVNIVGTPLSSLEKIICAGKDDDTFNGRCGAESGWVPVSATGPSLLVKTLELEKEYKEQNQPPVLPPPILEKAKGKQ
ncbi:MAG: peptidase U62 [Cyanobacteria bacterium SZAS TMP-1]|nr:peptidase U62 [Cyanobacteria bacterium SZAS TMP-1]